jgi:hypothetical protein
MRGLNLNVWLSRRRSLEKDLRRGGGSAIPPPFGEWPTEVSSLTCRRKKKAGEKSCHKKKNPKNPLLKKIKNKKKIGTGNK